MKSCRKTKRRLSPQKTSAAHPKTGATILRVQPPSPCIPFRADAATSTAAREAVPNGTYLRTVHAKNRRIASYPNGQRQAPGATSIVQRTFGCLVRRHSLCCKCKAGGLVYVGKLLLTSDLRAQAGSELSCSQTVFLPHGTQTSITRLSWHPTSAPDRPGPCFLSKCHPSQSPSYAHKARPSKRQTPTFAPIPGLRL